jgi:uncharacterized protein YfaT (DUF1175 family)
MKIVVELSDTQEAALERVGIMRGFLRKEPRRKWTKAEHAELIRYAVNRLITDEVGK